MSLINRSKLIWIVCLFLLPGCQSSESVSNGSNINATTNAQPAATELPLAGVNESGSAQEQYDFSGVDRLLERAVPTIGSGALLLIKDGRVVYRRAFGRGLEERVVPVASASKWLSAAVIMTLVDEGKLMLDDPISKYLTGFTGDKAGITIRQLFSHTSGLPPEARCRNDKSTTLERCAEEIARLKLRAKPGTEFHYGGVSMHVGGRIAEVVSGKAWNDLFIEKIAAPLGMTTTDYFSYGTTRNPRPEGDARSNVDDYGRFLQMLLNRGHFNGRRVLSETAVAEIHKDQTFGVPLAYTIYEKHGDLNPELLQARYGLGVWREVVRAETGELLEASSQGALGFSPWIDLERNLGGVLLVRSSFSKVMPLYLELKKEIRRVVHPLKTKLE